MSIAEHVIQLKKDFDEVRTTALNECISRHYVTEITGDNSDQIAFTCPFEPDAVIVLGFDPFAYVSTDCIMSLAFDLRAFGRRAGGVFVTPNKGNTTSSKGLLGFITKNADGAYVISGIVISADGNTAIFDARVKYQLIAVKYTDKTDKERITEFVENLPDGGTESLTMYADKVNATFTADEWATLIAQKPSYTFVMW